MSVCANAAHVHREIKLGTESLKFRRKTREREKVLSL